jgi:UDP-3-O-[3-hydroxymyristoyl] glucosamine N-acyltransferase
MSPTTISRTVPLAGGVGVGLGVGVGVAVGLGLGETVAVGMGVVLGVASGVGLGLEVGVGARVAVGAGVPPGVGTTMTDGAMLGAQPATTSVTNTAGIRTWPSRAPRDAAGPVTSGHEAGQSTMVCDCSRMNCWM